MSVCPLKLIVGLGNPGSEYERTRHNAGFWLVDLIARKYGSTFRFENKFNSLACRVSIASRSVWLLKPQTFMNRSGQALVPFCHFYKLQPVEILVAHDELDLPLGSLRLKRGGGAGGHNGLRSIMQLLGQGDFLRLRIGIGHPGQRQGVTGHVLRAPSAAERELLEQALLAAVKMMPQIVTGEVDKVMNVLHRRAAAIAPAD